VSCCQADLQLAGGYRDLACTFGNWTTPVVNSSVLAAAPYVQSASTSPSPVVFVHSPARIQFDFTWPVIAKFHYTDTDKDTDTNGPARTQRSIAAKKSVSVSVGPVSVSV